MKPADSDKRDFAVRELEASRPCLRDDLSFAIQEFRGERCCVIEDPAAGKFYRVGLREYHFIKKLDGNTTVGQAQSQMSESADDSALTETEVISVLRWLLETGLAATDESTRADLMFSKVEKKRDMQLKSYSNLLFFKQSLFNPDRLMGLLEKAFGFWAGKAGWAAWGVLMLVGVTLIGWHWERFIGDAEGVLASDNWLWLALSWIFLKMIHECWHGVVCKRYGGRVPDAGVLFVLFTPMGYVDATSSWRFASKWQRIHVSAAGMFIEMAIAAIAVIVWSQDQPGIMQTIAYNVIIMASFVTLLFNINPLLKFDGYYILADAMEIPNLYQRGQKALKDAARRYLIGISHVPDIQWKDREEVFILIYGIAAFIWRILIMVSILTAASFLFGGGGIVLAIISLLMMVIPAAIKLIRYLREGSPGERPDPKAYGLRIGIITAALLLLVLFPFRPTLTAPGVSDFGDASTLRVECPGFVRKIHVTPGSKVRAGDLILTLENQDERAKLRRLRMQLKQAQIKARYYQTEGQMTAAQIETQKLTGLQQQLREQASYVRTLEIRAEASGRIIARDLRNLPDTFLRPGFEVATIAKRQLREVKIAIPQADIDLYRLHQEHPVWVKIIGRPGKFYGIMQPPEPQATRELPHMALGGVTGGPLPVQPRSTQTQASDNETDRYELIEPHFITKISLKERLEENLASGEMAQVKFTSRQSRPLWKWFYQKIGNYMNTLTRTAEAQATG